MTEAQIKEKLNSYRIARRDTEIAIRRIRTLEEQATVTGSLAIKGVRVMSSLPKDARFEDPIEEKADLEKIIADEMKDREKLQQEVTQLISKASNTKQRWLLTLRYIDCLNWNTVAKVMGYNLDDRNVFKIHRKAIKAICKKWTHTDT